MTKPRAEIERRKAAAPTYEPPDIEWEEEFDVVANLASACAKVALQNLACNASPSS